MRLPSPPDLSGLRTSWLNQFILVSSLMVNVKEPYRSYLVYFFRRIEASIEAYKQASLSLQEYGSTPRKVISSYFRALSHFETCLAFTYHAYLISEKLNGSPLSKAGDGSPYDRLRRLYNDTKHSDERIEDGDFSAAGSLPVWLSETGLESAKGTSVTLEEFAEFLRELANLATKIVDGLEEHARATSAPST